MSDPKNIAAGLFAQLDPNDIDVIADRLPKGAAALVIQADGQAYCICPRLGAEERVPDNMAAVTELMVRLSDGELSLDELAAAMEKRVTEAH